MGKITLILLAIGCLAVVVKLATKIWQQGMIDEILEQEHREVIDE